MSEHTVAGILAELAGEYAAQVVSSERDTRLVLPGLTRQIAIQMQADLENRLSEIEAVNLPVYLVLDDDDPIPPSEPELRLHYEAVTSIRHKSFLAICMPEVLSKLQDSVRGSGSPLRGVAFHDEWPWDDSGSDTFRFKTQFLPRVVSRWTSNSEEQDLLKDLILETLVRESSVLADKVRVQLLIEHCLGGFDPSEPTELGSVVDRFAYHCGLMSTANWNDLTGYRRIVGRLSKTLQELRARHPEYREYLVDEVADLRLADNPDREGIKEALHLGLDGFPFRGLTTGVLAFSGSVGRNSTSQTTENWRRLSVDFFSNLLTVSENDEITCTLRLSGTGGVLSKVGTEAAVFADSPPTVQINATVRQADFQPGVYSVELRKGARVLATVSCDEPTTAHALIIDPDELPLGSRAATFRAHLTRGGQVLQSSRTVRVHCCSPARAAVAVIEPGFEVIDLTEPDELEGSEDAVSLQGDEPFWVDLLDWQAAGPVRVTVDDDDVALDLVAAGGTSHGWEHYRAASSIDPEDFSGGVVQVGAWASGLGCELTLSSTGELSGEFTLEDELRAAFIEGKEARLKRVLDVFKAPSAECNPPRLGGIGEEGRWRVQAGRLMENPESGWKPVLTDFLQGLPFSHHGLVERAWYRSVGDIPGFLETVEVPQGIEELIRDQISVRGRLLHKQMEIADTLPTDPDRPLYAAIPLYVEQESAEIGKLVAEYLSTYEQVLRAVPNVAHNPAALFCLLHLDSLVFRSVEEGLEPIEYGLSLLGPWHPLVVAKRFLVQQAMVRAASSGNPISRSFRHLGVYFEMVEGPRLGLTFNGNELATEPSYQFATSDPGWHLAIGQTTANGLVRTHLRGLRGLAANLHDRLDIRCSVHPVTAGFVGPSFVQKFQKTHPSRRQVSVRLESGIDERSVLDGCRRALSSTKEAELLPGGIHLYSTNLLKDRSPIPWTEPAVFLYEGLSDEECFSSQVPDVHLLPPKEEWRLAPLPAGSGFTGGGAGGVGPTAIFSFPVMELKHDRRSLPETRYFVGRSRLKDPSPKRGGVGAALENVLHTSEAIREEFHPHTPILTRPLGLPGNAPCEWTVLPGSEVDPAALSSYVASGAGTGGEARVLWEYHVELGKSLGSYFVVSKLPHSVRLALSTNPLVESGEASSVLTDLGEAGFAVGETMRTGSAAVGVLGVVGALRLLRASWAGGETEDWRWETAVLPVDCFQDFFVNPTTASGNRKRADLLGLHLTWTTRGIPSLILSFCAVECKYASASFPPGSVSSGMEQAQATADVVRDLLTLAGRDDGLHARLALTQLVWFGLRLLQARRVTTPNDECRVLSSILSGNFRVADPLVGTLLVSTSAGVQGPTQVDPRPNGWWIDMTGESWPRVIPNADLSVVRTLSKIFQWAPAIPGIDEEEDSRDDWPDEGLGTDGPEPGGPVVPGGGKIGGPYEASTPSAQPTEEPSTDSEGPPTPKEDGEPSTREPVLGGEAEGDKAGDIHDIFRGFVGNGAAVRTLSLDLLYAEKKGIRKIDAVALVGPHSTGKTELAKRLGTALDIPCLELNEMSLRNLDDLAIRMQELARESGTPMQPLDRVGGKQVLLSPPMVVFIDEVHQLQKRVQDMLLPVLEARDRTLRASDVIIDTREASFVVATTDWGRLREPLRSRLRTVRLNPYSVDEVVEMLQVALSGARPSGPDGEIDFAARELSGEALSAIATAARAVPRVALDRLRQIGKAISIGQCGSSKEEVWRYLENQVPCDRRGLTPLDRKYIEVLYRMERAGLKNLADELATDTSNVEGDIEPFLIQCGWIYRGATGRGLTRRGRSLAVELNTEKG